MVEQIVNEMLVDVKKMQDFIIQDIEDIKKAEHKELLNRNDEKQYLIENITEHKKKLNEEIVKEMQSGVDVNIYREKIDSLEDELERLYDLNKKLSLIVLPIQKMYKDIVDDISDSNGGSVFNVKA